VSGPYANCRFCHEDMYLGRDCMTYKRVAGEWGHCHERCLYRYNERLAELYRRKQVRRRLRFRRRVVWWLRLLGAPLPVRRAG